MNASKLKEDIKTLYSIFSEFSHTTLSTVKEIQMEIGELHTDFAFFQDYSYDRDFFNLCYTNITKTLDCVIAVLILVESNFLGYDTPIKFLNSLDELFKELVFSSRDVKDIYPHLSSLIEKKV